MTLSPVVSACHLEVVSLAGSDVLVVVPELVEASRRRSQSIRCWCCMTISPLQSINQSINRWIFDEMKIEQEEEREAGKTNKKEKVEKR